METVVHAKYTTCELRMSSGRWAAAELRENLTRTLADMGKRSVEIRILGDSSNGWQGFTVIVTADKLRIPAKGV